MAVNFESFKEPKVLIIVGIAVVGGIYFASKMRGKKDSEVPTEVGVNYAVQSVDSVEREDAIQRELSAKEDKLAELEKLQKEEQEKYKEALNSASTQFQSERDAFNQRLVQQEQNLSSRYSSEIASLRTQIDALLARQVTTQPVVVNPQPQQPSQPASGGGKPTGNTGPITPRPKDEIRSQEERKPQPQPQPVQSVKKYPGLPDNYQMDCGNFQQGLIYSSFDALVADQRKKMNSQTFLARNASTIAITGATTPWLYSWASLGIGSPYRAQVNNSRVRWGIAPLTEEEFQEMVNMARSLWPDRDEKNPTYRNLTYARQLWERFNRPYQCGVSQARK